MRTAAVAALVAAGLQLGVPAVAGASEESVGACLVHKVHDFEAEGLEGAELEERVDRSSDDCLQSPNPILPATNEIIWGGLSFLVLLAAMWKWGVPAIKKGMETRTERIRSDLAAAEEARQSAEAAQADVEAQLRNARAEAATIIDQAREQADVVRADLQRRAEADIAELRTRAEAEVAAARAAAQDDVRREVAALAIGAAEVVVGKELENSAAQVQLIEDYINQVGTQR
jgi:F-type H+-transporting ATPase subunit b